MSPFDSKPSDSFTFSNMLPCAEKEDTFSNTLPSAEKEDTFSNTLPSAEKEDTFSNTLPAYTRDEENTFSNTLPPDAKDPTVNPPPTPSEQRTNRRLLFSHVATSVFAIPTLTLLSLDLHAYQTRTATTLPLQRGQFATAGALLTLDVMSVILLSATLLYAIAFLSLRFHHQITPLFLREHATPIHAVDAFLCVAIQALSDTIIGMRTGPEVTGCQRFAYVDPNACESGRRTIMRTAGAMGILTSFAIHVRWVSIMHIWWYRRKSQQS